MPFSELRILVLGQVDQLLVVAEIHVLEFGVPVEAERLHDEGVELARQKVGQEEGGEILVGALGEILVAGEEGVTVRSGQALDALALAESVDIAARAAIGIADEDPVKSALRASAIALSRAGAIFCG